MVEDPSSGYVRGKAPGPGQIHTVLEGVGIGSVGGDDQGQAGGIKQELGEKLRLFNRVLVDNWEKNWSADHVS